MVGFEVSINGERLCLAAIEHDGVLDLSLVHSVRAGTDIPPFWLSVGGLTKGEHVTWVTGEQHKLLKLGDTLQVRLIETDEADPILDRSPAEDD